MILYFKLFKGGFKSESAMCFSNLQKKIPNNYPELVLKAKLFKKRITWPVHWPISDELLRLQIQNNSSWSNLFDDVTR